MPILNHAYPKSVVEHRVFVNYVSRLIKFTLPQDLTAYVEKLKLSQSDLDVIKGMIEKVSKILQKSSSFNRHDMVYLGGSLSKGTAVKNQTDADIIVFKNPNKIGT